MTDEQPITNALISFLTEIRSWGSPHRIALCMEDLENLNRERGAPVDTSKAIEFCSVPVFIDEKVPLGEANVSWISDSEEDGDSLLTNTAETWHTRRILYRKTDEAKEFRPEDIEGCVYSWSADKGVTCDKYGQGSPVDTLTPDRIVYVNQRVKKVIMLETDDLCYKDKNGNY